MLVRELLDRLLEMPIPEPVLIPPAIGIFCPAYFSASGAGLANWNRLIAAAATVPVVAVANPASGPGDASSFSYASVIDRATAAGVRVLGYVSTAYGQRPADEVRDDVEKWQLFYPTISGIFFDEQPSMAAKALLYASYYAHARASVAKAFIASNPGSACDGAFYYQGRPDVLCLVETSVGNTVGLPPWAWEAPDGYFAGLVYAQDEVQMRDLVAKLRAIGLGWIYVTADRLPNPWDTLPPYFEALVAAVRAVV